jgi:CheY-like chemotaxis protein
MLKTTHIGLMEECHIKILYVEDNPVATKNAQRIAAELEYDMFVAETVAEGLDHLNHSLDLIMVDMELPDGNGLELVRLARKQMPTIPIVAISGYALIGEEKECMEAGCTEYVRKPIRLEQLTDLIKRYARPE